MSAMRTWSPVGRVVAPRGTTRRCPLREPAMTRISIEQGAGTRADATPVPRRAHSPYSIVRRTSAESSGAGERELATPPGQEARAQGAVRRLAELGVGGDDRLSLLARLLEDGGVTEQVGGAELGESRLPGAEELAGPAQLEGDFRDLEAVVRRDHRVDAPPGLFGEPAARQERSEERRVGKECRSRWSPYH